MKLRFDGMLSSDGGFSDIWRAFDATERLVAVKIIRDSSVEISDALAHAKALVRAAHKNIVTVFAVTDVEDPGRSGTYVPAIVMEYLSGETLHDAMSYRLFSDMDFLKISIGIIDALRHIHQSGMVHGDLHEKNVMLVAGEVKVIDLLYRYSLLSVDATKHEHLKRREIDFTCLLITQLAMKSSLDTSHLAAFLQDKKKVQSLDALLEAVWKLCGAPAGAISPTPTSFPSRASTVPATSPHPQLYTAESMAAFEKAGEAYPDESKQDVGPRSAKVVPRIAHLTILNRGLGENDYSHIATLTFITDEPVALSQSVGRIKNQLKQSILLDKALIASDPSLEELLKNSGTQPRLLEWLATTSFSAHLYFSARASLEDKAVWPESRLVTELVVLPIVHRLSDKSIQVERLASNIEDIRANLDEALTQIKTEYHRTVVTPALGDQKRNPDRLLMELADLVLSCSLMYLTNPGDDYSRAIFAHVRTRLKYAVNVPTSERHTRNKNPLH